MIAVILVASIESELVREIGSRPELSHLRGLPKALLPLAGKSILDHWWFAIRGRRSITEVYIVTNGAKYKAYERWATSKGLPVRNVVNNGTTTKEGRLGAARDLLKGLTRAKATDEDVLVFGGENIFYEGFDIEGPLRYFETTVKSKGSLALTYELSEDEPQNKRGVAIVDSKTKKILKFWEKPTDGVTTTRTAVPLFYIFKKEVIPMLREFVEKESKLKAASQVGCGHFLEWLVSSGRHSMFTMNLPSGFSMIGASVGLKQYMELNRDFKEAQKGEKSVQITKRSYARVGLMGNPSDGFHGKTIALTIRNYWAQCTLTQSDKIRILPHPLYDPTEYPSLSSLYDVARREGYSGGIRLLTGTCKKFFEWCVRYGIALPDKKFSLSYDTNIPRQVGLAGSSAIVSSTFACLMEFYHLGETEFPKALQPQFVLDVEMQELNISAGLQDRVVQIYQGLVFMDFSKELFEKQGHGNYENMNPQGLPTVFLAYVADPSDSGKIHNDVRKRWISGDKVVIDAMCKFAEYTDRAKTALSKGDQKAFTSLMKMNFELRRSVYGDACLGKDNLMMIKIANKFGCAAKFPGSGGAVVGACPVEKLDALMQAYEDAGFVFVKVEPYVPTST